MIENILNTIQETVIPAIQLEESYKVDVIRIFHDDLQHIKLNSLCEYLRWEIIQKAIIGQDSNGLSFYSYNNCSLSDIVFYVEGDLVENREFELRSHWPTRGYPLAFKPEEGITTRRILGLSLVQDFTYLVNSKSLPNLPPLSPISEVEPLNSKPLPNLPPLSPLSPLLPLPELEPLNLNTSRHLSTIIEVEEPLQTPNLLSNNIYLLENENISADTLVNGPTPDEIMLLNIQNPNGPTALANRLEFQLNWNQTQINNQNSLSNTTNQLSEID